MSRQFLDDTLQHGNVRAFLMMIRHCEGTADENGYSALFGYRPGDRQCICKRLDRHPAIYTSYVNKAGKKILTSAAGAYQITKTTWDSLVKLLELPDFSPESQDEAALELIRERNAIKYIIEGNVERAIKLVRTLWASLPGSGNNQPEKSLEQCLQWFTAAGGQISNL